MGSAKSNAKVLKKDAKKRSKTSPLTTQKAKKIIQSSKKPVTKEVEMDFGSDIDDEEEEMGIPEITTLSDDDDDIVVYDETLEAKDDDDDASSVQPKGKAERGVVYLGRIPHGFYEEEMREYFSQFGKVTRLRLSRNKKTGRSKHYAFIEFEDAEVAQIVATTMDQYLMFGHTLRAQVVPSGQVHPDLFKGCDKKYRVVNTVAIHRKQFQKSRSPDQLVKLIQKRQKKEQERSEKLKKLGIDYEYVPAA